MKDEIEHDYLSENTLRRYVEGLLSPQESRKVERLLEKYPLYAEAVEGYQQQGQVPSLDRLRSKLAQKKPRTKMHSLSSAYRRAAAWVVLLASTGLLWWLTNRYDSVEQNLSYATEEMPANTSPLADTTTDQEPIGSTDSGAAYAKQEAKRVEVHKPKDTSKGLQEQNLLAAEEEHELNVAETRQETKPTIVNDAAKEKADIPSEDAGVLAAPAPSELSTEVKESPKTKKESARKKSRSPAATLVAEQVSIEQLRQQIMRIASNSKETLAGDFKAELSLSFEGVVQEIKVLNLPCKDCEQAIKDFLLGKRWQEKSKEKPVLIVLTF